MDKQDDFSGWAIVRHHADGTENRTAIVVQTFPNRKQPAICVENDNVLFPVAYISSVARRDLFLATFREFWQVGHAAIALVDAIARSPYDVSPCVSCGKPVVCLPDGQPCCVDCAAKEDEL